MFSLEKKKKKKKPGVGEDFIPFQKKKKKLMKSLIYEKEKCDIIYFHFNNGSIVLSKNPILCV
jgi:hypothetical protein